MEIKLRKFIINDLDYICKNWVSTDRFSGWVKNSTKEQLTLSIERWNTEKRSDGKTSLTYCIDFQGNPIGMIRLSENVENKLNLDVQIDEPYCGKGIAPKAFSMIQEIALSKGFKILTSSCTQDNLRSTAFHKKVGFALVKEELSPTGYPMYRWEKQL